MGSVKNNKAAEHKQSAPSHNLNNFFSVRNVGHMPRIERHADGRNGFGKTYQPKRQRVVGERVNLPTHYDGLQMNGERNKKTTHDEESKVANVYGGMKITHRKFGGWRRRLFVPVLFPK